MKRLFLKRPLAFFDIEATGLNPQTDRIIELCIVKLFPAGNKEVETFRYNPTVPIPPGSTLVHGITDDQVKDYPTFASHAPKILQILEGCDLAGFNSNSFDIPMIFAEVTRAGLQWDLSGVEFVDAGNLFKIMEPRTLVKAVMFYLSKEHTGAHGAKADTLATLDVLLSQLDKYPDLPGTVPELALKSNYDKKRGPDLAGKFGYNEADKLIFTFGKYKDQEVNEVVKRDQGYFNYLLQGENNPADFVAICKKALSWKPKAALKVETQQVLFNTQLGANDPNYLP